MARCRDAKLRLSRSPYIGSVIGILEKMIENEANTVVTPDATTVFSRIVGRFDLWDAIGHWTDGIWR